MRIYCYVRLSLIKDDKDDSVIIHLKSASYIRFVNKYELDGSVPEGERSGVSVVSAIWNLKVHSTGFQPKLDIFIFACVLAHIAEYSSSAENVCISTIPHIHTLAPTYVCMCMKTLQLDNLFFSHML